MCVAMHVWGLQSMGARFRMIIFVSVFIIGQWIHMASITVSSGSHMAQWSLVVPRGGWFENERRSDSSALGWQLNPKRQGTDVSLTPPPLLSSLITIKPSCPFAH